MNYRPRQKTQAGLVLSQNAVTACILINDPDLSGTVPVKHLTFLLPEQRESVLRLGDGSGLTVK